MEVLLFSYRVKRLAFDRIPDTLIEELHSIYPPYTMNLLTTIDDSKDSSPKDLQQRTASRAVLFDEQKRVPLLYVAKHAYHKLPGGGIDEGEEPSEALIREILEEVGARIKVTGEVGEIIEVRSEFNLHQTSYCYTGDITEKGTPNFTEKELEQGFEVHWMSLEEAINTVESDIPKNYEGKFIQKRDLFFLKKTKELIHTIINPDKRIIVR